MHARLAAHQDWCVSRQLWWGHRIPVWYAHASQADADAAEEGRSDRCACTAELQLLATLPAFCGVPAWLQQHVPEHPHAQMRAHCCCR